MSAYEKIVDGKRYPIAPFEVLEASTETVMIYTNVLFDADKIFRSLKVTPVTVPLTKKQKNVDKKRLDAPYGAIISVQSSTMIRGVPTYKKKKKWCTVCRPIEKTESGKEIKVLTITEFLRPMVRSKAKKVGEPEPPFVPDAQQIMYHCSRCNKDYLPAEQKKINHFLNQVTVVISIGKHPILNIMLFRDSLKIAGCKSEEDAAEALLILWQDYLHPMGCWKPKPGVFVDEPKFIFDIVMRNVDFQLGFYIDREALNRLMNDQAYADKIYMSQYETTGHTNVNIKMHSSRPKTLLYNRLVVPQDTNESPYYDTVVTNDYRNTEKKAKNQYITFIVFSSSEVILSGRYFEKMRDMYNFFVNTVLQHREMVEERVVKPDESAVASIRQRKV